MCMSESECETVLHLTLANQKLVLMHDSQLHSNKGCCEAWRCMTASVIVGARQSCERDFTGSKANALGLAYVGEGQDVTLSPSRRDSMDLAPVGVCTWAPDGKHELVVT